MIHEKLLTTLEAARLLECPGELPEEKAQNLMLELFQMGFVTPASSDWDYEKDGLPEIPVELFWKPSLIQAVKNYRKKNHANPPTDQHNQEYKNHFHTPTPSPGESTGIAQGKRPPLLGFDRLTIHSFVESHIGAFMSHLCDLEIDPGEVEAIMERLKP